jgi:flagellar hook-basal body complex protein FliE
MIDRIAPAASSVASPVEVGAADLVRGAAATASPAAEGADFGAMLGAFASNALSVVKDAEVISVAGVRGHASVQQVVEAVMSAEQTLQGAIALRDKVVSAYLELSRMSI